MREYQTLADQPEAKTHRINPARLREILQRLGPTFVKVGQFLALRPDLIPQEYCDEFLKLVDAVPPFPFSIARRFIKEDLGGEPDELFAWINPRPVAAASLAQVHQARTHQGDSVAVKIQRPDIHKIMHKDLKRLRRLSRLVTMAGMVVYVSVPEVLNEFERWMKDELDMRLELRNLTRMYDLSSGASSFRVPRPYPELSGRRVLTAEFLRGVAFSELLRMVRAGESEDITNLGLDRDLLAHNLIHTVLEQIFRFHFFHADTHPGNLIAMPGNVVGFVDFGLTDTLDSFFRPGIMHFASAVYANDIQGMLHGLLEVLTRKETADPESFRSDFIAETRTWLRERDRSGGDGRDSGSPTGHYMISVLRAARRNNMQIPTGVLSMYRALLTAETVAAQLGGEADLRSVGRRFFYRLQIENMIEMTEPEQLQPVLSQFIELLRNGPGQLQRFLSDLTEDRFVLRVRNSETPADRLQANTRARLVTTAIVSVGVAVLLAGKDQTIFADVRLSYLLWGVLIIIYVSIIALWRRLS